MKIGRNDSTLAHALAKSAAGEQMNRDIARMRDWGDEHSGKRTLKAAFRTMRAVFGERVLHEVILREKGSRAAGHLFILQPMGSGDMALFLLSWLKGKVRLHDTPVMVSHHALARMMQRTVGQSNLTECCERLKPYVLAAAAASVRKVAGSYVQLTVAGDGGALIFRRDEKMVVAVTWLDKEMMADPKLRAAAEKSELTMWWE